MPRARLQHSLNVEGILDIRYRLEKQAPFIPLCPDDQLVDIPHVRRADPAFAVFPAGIRLARVAKLPAEGHGRHLQHRRLERAVPPERLPHFVFRDHGLHGVFHPFRPHCSVLKSRIRTTPRPAGDRAPAPVLFFIIRHPQGNSWCFFVDFCIILRSACAGFRFFPEISLEKERFVVFPDFRYNSGKESGKAGKRRTALWSPSGFFALFLSLRFTLVFPPVGNTTKLYKKMPEITRNPVRRML